jgi:hypothetical protein
MVGHLKLSHTDDLFLSTNPPHLQTYFYLGFIAMFSSSLLFLFFGFFLQCLICHCPIQCIFYLSKQ